MQCSWRVSVAVVVAIVAIAAAGFSLRPKDYLSAKVLQMKLETKATELKQEAESALLDAQKTGKKFIEDVEGMASGTWKTVEDALSFGKPSADLKRVRIPQISSEEIKLIFDVEIKNPNPIPIPLVDILYGVVINDREIISGKIPDAGTIGGHDSMVVEIGVDLNFTNVKAAFNDFKAGSRCRYLLKVNFVIDVPVLGRVDIPVHHDGDFPVPSTPDIDLEELDWIDLSLTETKAVAYVNVTNVNDFALMIKSFEYKLFLTDNLIAEGKVETVSALTEKGEIILKVPFTFRPKDLGHAVWDIISGSDAVYKLKGKLFVDSPYGQIVLPFRKAGRTSFRRRHRD